MRTAAESYGSREKERADAEELSHLRFCILKHSLVSEFSRACDGALPDFVNMTQIYVGNETENVMLHGRAGRHGGSMTIFFLSFRILVVVEIGKTF